MCGIAGIWNFHSAPVDPAGLSQMGKLLAHRGPDGEGTYLQDSLGLVHRRLAILDLSPSGHQPMSTPDGRYVLVFNGEIYNYRELRRELQAQGTTFRSDSDTEVLLHGLARHGKAYVERLVGMFAFGFWDQTEKSLLLCRDRLGIKPLYYALDRRRVVFASEIKPLLAVGVPAQLDPAALSSYFSLRYTPGAQTLFKPIRKLEPGTLLSLRQDGSHQSWAYWSLPKVAEAGLAGLECSEKEAQDKFYRLLDEATELCLISDVPVGAFLSGGIDSAAIVALMKRHQEKVETFTMAIGGGIDESQQAAWIAEQVGANNTRIELQNGDLDLFRRALWSLEEPLGDSIIVPTYLLAQAASRKVKVVELGEGADEILGGYVHQLVLNSWNAAHQLIPSRLMQGLVKGAQSLPQVFWEKIFPYPATLGKSGTDRFLRFVGQSGDLAEAYLNLVSVFNPEEQRQLFAPGVSLSGADAGPLQLFRDFLSRAPNVPFFNQLLMLDLRFWTPDYGLMRMDKLTMAHGLEARVPYLDHRLVEHCLALPAKYQIRLNRQKRLMRRGLQGRKLLPDQVLRAPKKSFFLPAKKRFGQTLQALIQDTLSSAAVKQRGIFSVRAIDDLREGRGSDLLTDKKVMAVFLFELWAKLYLDGEWASQVSPAALKEAV